MRLSADYNLKKTHEKEYVIKKVPVQNIVFYLGSLILFTSGVEKLIDAKYFLGIFLTAFGIAFIYLRKLEPKKSQAVIKINSERLWNSNMNFENNILYNRNSRLFITWSCQEEINEATKANVVTRYYSIFLWSETKIFTLLKNKSERKTEMLTTTL